MATSDRTLRLVFTGRDETGQAVKSVTGSLQQLKTAVRSGQQDLTTYKQAHADSVAILRNRQKEERLLRNEFRESNQAVYDVTNTMNRIGSAGMRVNQVLVNHNLIQQRIKQTNKDVEISYKHLQESIDRYGSNSQQATAAQEDLNASLEEQKKLNNDMIGQYAVMGLALSGIGTDVLRTVESVITRRRQRRLDGNADVDVNGGGFNTALGGLAAVEGARTAYSVINRRRGIGRGNPNTGTLPAGSSTPIRPNPTVETVTQGKGASLARAGRAGLMTTGGLLVADLIFGGFGEHIDNFLEGHGINILRSKEDKILKDMGGIPDQYLVRNPKDPIGEFYKDYDQKLSVGQVNIYVNDMKDANQLKEELEGIGNTYQQ